MNINGEEIVFEDWVEYDLSTSIIKFGYHRKFITASENPNYIFTVKDKDDKWVVRMWSKGNELIDVYDLYGIIYPNKLYFETVADAKNHVDYFLSKYDTLKVFL